MAGKGHNSKGRSLTKGCFAMVPKHVMDSAAYVATSAVGCAVLFELARLYHGHNNGRLGLSCREAAARIGCSKDTAMRAFHELQEHGLIEPATKGHFSVKATPMASTWRLTWRKCDRANTLPTNTFERWKPLAPDAPAKPKKKIVGPITGTVRSDHRDGHPDNKPERSDHRDSLAIFPARAVRSQGHS